MAAVLGVVRLALGFEIFTLLLIFSYPAAIVPEVQAYTIQSISWSGRISLVTSVLSQTF